MSQQQLYYDFATFLSQYFEGKVQKISIHAGFTCPNRDGSKGTGGCTYCNNQTFNPDYCKPEFGIRRQLEDGIGFFARKYPTMRYLAYFQAYTNTYGEGDFVELAGLSFKVLHTPGHTPGSVCLMCENALFSGDTLFGGSCGRTDLPGGSWTTIRVSLKRLADLSGDYDVYPGHGDSTTLSFERKMNPYMQ